MTKHQDSFKYMLVGDILLYRYIRAKSQDAVRQAVRRYNKRYPGRLITNVVGGGIEVKRVE